jgi:hypothetical protein
VFFSSPESSQPEGRRPGKPLNSKHLWAGLLLLAVGILIYVTARPPDSVPRILSPLSRYLQTPWGPSYVTYSLPTLTHTAAFILLTTAVLNCRLSCAAAVSAVWLVLELLFELGQHPALSAACAASVPGWLERLPGFEQLRAYFVLGSYDSLDLSAAVIGALLALGIVSLAGGTNR